MKQEMLETINAKEKTNKKIINGIIKLITFLIILTICLQVVYNITKKKYAYQKSYDFFNQKEEFDVLFFGSSHIYTEMYPMQLWKDYGIVSYNMGQSSATLALSYYNMILALEETNPKLVVLDTYLVFDVNKIHRQNAKLSKHYVLDTYPLSYTKISAIKGLLEKPTLDEYIEYLFNFSIYHARWDELTKTDFLRQETYTKGAERRIAVANPNEIIDIETVDEYSGEETINMQYLRKIIEYCKEKNIEILVTYVPYPAPEQDIAASKHVKTICDEYGVNYINFLNMNVVNYNTDCYDEKSHLNVSGAVKITDYIGKYITENYEIPDQRSNKQYEFWNEDYNKYIDLKIKNLASNEKNLNNYLMLLYGEKDISYEIKISSSKKIEEGSTLKKLLENLDNKYEINDEIFKEKQDKTIKISTYDNRTKELIKTIWF